MIVDTPSSILIFGRSSLIFDNFDSPWSEGHLFNTCIFMIRSGMEVKKSRLAGDSEVRRQQTASSGGGGTPHPATAARLAQPGCCSPTACLVYLLNFWDYGDMQNLSSAAVELVPLACPFSCLVWARHGDWSLHELVTTQKWCTSPKFSCI